MTTAERLQQFYDFDDDILESVSQVAHDQRNKSFAQLADQYKVAGGPRWTYPFYDERAVDYYYFGPRRGELAGGDPTTVRLYHAPMATPADTNMAMRAIRLYAADPSVPLMVVGNPAAVGLRKNRIRRQELKTVWQGNLTPLAEPVIEHLASCGVSSADFIGYSYGAEISPIEAATAKKYGITAKRGVWLEPSAVISRTLLQLGAAFAGTGGQKLTDAVARVESQALYEARQQADVGLRRWGLGLLRASNLAIAHAITTSSFVGRAERALFAQPDLQVTVGWGDRSELAEPTEMLRIVQQLRDHNAPRVGSIVLRGMNHAGGDDIDLHTAMVLQGLRTQPKS